MNFNNVFGLCALILSGISSHTKHTLRDINLGHLTHNQLRNLRSSTGGNDSRTYIMREQGGAEFLSAGDKKYPGFGIGFQGVTQIPYIYNKLGERPNLKIIVMPPMGAETSHMGALMPSLQILDEVLNNAKTNAQNGSRVARTAFIKNALGPIAEQLAPVEIIAFDYPGNTGGWGPEFTSAEQVLHYISDFLAISKLENHVPQFVLTQSWSGMLAIATEGLIVSSHKVVMDRPGGVMPSEEWSCNLDYRRSIFKNIKINQT